MQNEISKIGLNIFRFTYKFQRVAFGSTLHNLITDVSLTLLKSCCPTIY